MARSDDSRAGSARAVVVAFLDSVSARGVRLDQLTVSPSYLSLSLLDRGFAFELAYGILRWRGQLDFNLSQLSDRPVERLDASIAWILRLALYELEFLRTPDRAAVHEAVSLARVFKKTSAAAFVNAVLRRFQKEKPELPSGSSAFALSVRYSHPEWLVGRYLSRFGEAVTESLLQRNNRPPLPLVWVNQRKTDTGRFCEMLIAAGVSHELFPGLPNSVVINAPAFSQHPIYREGYCFFMDAASQEVAQLAALDQARLLGDFCSGAGSKAFLIAARATPGAWLHCADISYARIQELRARTSLYGARQITACVADLTRPAPFCQDFDFVLLDVPCTGLGTLRSNPDIRWKVNADHLPRFHDRQVAILNSGFRSLRAGGCLLYATCSTEMEENESVIEDFLQAEPLAELTRPYYRTYPEDHPGDCFFAAQVRHG